MELLSSQILISSFPVKDDAFAILMDSLPAQYNSEPKFLLTFSECVMAYKMAKQGGMIKRDKTYIHYEYQWEGEAWYLNASGYFDKLCKKYSIYPKYLKLS